MTPTERVLGRLPTHLRRFVVTQDYGAYTPRDQAVWRHILGRLARELGETAHPSYLRGLEATGIGRDLIPSLDEMNLRLSALDWSAVAVRGFIPPAVFTELQSLGVLAIASDIRDHRHVVYTPAPDIVHESAGHAPILADPLYGAFLRRAGLAGFKAISSLEDRIVFEAIRNLSVVKEDPGATPLDEALASERLQAACACRTTVSEGARASRLYWWTAEYGLVGDPPRIFGAGLLSSLQEAAHGLSPAVRKVPLSLDCVDQDFDITTLQPQLFVARDFDHLFEVLEAFEGTLAWKRGGDFGLEEALRARTVNHLVLDGGLEVTGIVTRLVRGRRRASLQTAVACLQGPVLASRDGVALDRPWLGDALVAFGGEPLPPRGPFTLELGPVRLSGFRVGEHEVIHLAGERRGVALDLPPRALLFRSGSLPSVAGGPGDPEAWDRWFGDLQAAAEGEAEAEARRRKGEALPPRLATCYREVRHMRDSGRLDGGRLLALREDLAAFPEDWLLVAEVDELLERCSRMEDA